MPRMHSFRGLGLLAAASMVAMAGWAAGAPPTAKAERLSVPVLVGFFSPDLTEACVNSIYPLEYYVSYHWEFKDDTLYPLAPLGPAPTIRLTFHTERGTASPQSRSISTAGMYGKTVSGWMNYKATKVGTEHLTIVGSTSDSDWKQEMTFEVKKCKEKVRGTADMSSVTSQADSMGGGLWQMVASLDVEATADVGEDGVTGTGTANFFMDEVFQGIAGGAMTCKMEPPWQGTGEVTVEGDVAADQQAQLTLHLDVASMPMAATNITCTGMGGLSGGFPLPVWVLDVLAMQLEPVPMSGGVTTVDLPFGQYVIPVTVSIVQRGAA